VQICEAKYHLWRSVVSTTFKTKKSKNNKDVDLSWNNKSNQDFYEGVSIEQFKEWAKLGGFDEGCDLDLILPHLKKAKTILEVGAGYGRVVGYLLKQNLSAEISAIERSKSLCEYMEKLYGSRADIICGDLGETNFYKKFDVVIWLWSNISDFAKHEHVSTLRRIASWIEKGGVLVTDILLDSFNTERVNASDRNYVFQDGGRFAHGYLPTKDEILNYATEVGFEKIEAMPYQTNTSRNRCLFMLSCLN
jgi:2-polyprenyl-3-methyl-5-hydroxy-6-metoxy-1,4-benzoquinol methylase